MKTIQQILMTALASLIIVNPLVAAPGLMTNIKGSIQPLPKGSVLTTPVKAGTFFFQYRDYGGPDIERGFYRFKGVGIPRDFLEMHTDAPLPLSAKGNFRDLPNGTYVVEFSTDLSTWEEYLIFTSHSTSEGHVFRNDGLEPTGSTFIGATDDATAHTFIVNNNYAGDINTSSITIQVVGTNAAAQYSEYKAMIFAGGIQRGLSKNLDSNGFATFNDISVINPLGGQVEFHVVIDTTDEIASGDVAFTQLAVTANAGSTTFDVLDGTDIQVGDVLTLGKLSEVGTELVMVTAVVGNTITVQNPLSANHLRGKFVFERSDDTFRVDIINIEADNVENGKPVVMQGLPLQGATFDVYSSGALAVEPVNVNPDSNILVPNVPVPVAGYKLIGIYDAIEGKDFYYINDVDGDGIPDNIEVGDRFHFSLRDEVGNILDSNRIMINGRLHFELTDVNRVRVPNGGYKNIFVWAHPRTITEESQTGKKLRLVIDTAQQEKGFEADTVSTGNDLSGSSISVFDPLVGETFVVHRTSLSFFNVATQPVFTSRVAVTTGGVANPLYRFAVSANAAYGGTLKQVPFEVVSTNGVLEGGGKLANSSSLRLFRYSDAFYTGVPTEVPLVITGTAPNAVLTFTDSEDVEAGETVYYELHTTESITDTTNDSDKINVRISPEGSILWTDRANFGAENTVQLTGDLLQVPSVPSGAVE